MQGAGLRVLLTNTNLVHWAGSELYVRDVALALQSKGMRPMVYSPRLGAFADTLRDADIPVVNELRMLPEQPQLIHGHHNRETMTALRHFPRIPAVYFCHGILPWQEIPPRHPRILRYVAASKAIYECMLIGRGIQPDQTRIILNFVDLKRYRPRPSLPPAPSRALIFSNSATEATQIPAIRTACAEHGIILDVVGLRNGNPTSNPEELLVSYDLVFARGRSALEALAVGAAVVLCDCEGAGPMVTTANLDGLRQLNLGLLALREPLNAAVISREIRRYNADDASKVSTFVRASACITAAADQICVIYREVSDQWQRCARPSEAAEFIAYLRYLWSAYFWKRRAEHLARQRVKKVRKLFR